MQYGHSPAILPLGRPDFSTQLAENFVWVDAFRTDVVAEAVSQEGYPEYRVLVGQGLVERSTRQHASVHLSRGEA